MILSSARNALAPALAAALFLLSPPVLPQAPNPAVRGANTSPRVGTQLRAPLAVTERAASGASPFPAGCGDNPAAASIGAEVEPYVAINPMNPANVIGVWQQDRYTTGAARGLMTGVSFDGGNTWTLRPIPWSVCSGGEFQRATDPWVTFSPDGTAHQVALGVSGESFTSSGVSAILASRSTDGGLTWSAPLTLIRDEGADFFNDKEAITADPTDARFVYAIWDRLRANVNGPTLFTRSTDGGLTWEPARTIFVPPGSGQTIGNVIRVLPDGTLVNLFTQILGPVNSLQVIRSTDRGLSWSAPIQITVQASLGARDPDGGTPIRDGSIIPQISAGPDGSLVVVWQDARFTGVRDAVALSRSTDGGFTWSTPVRVNPVPTVAAFTPQVHVRADGMIGVTYYDLRSNTPSLATLPTDFWLARSRDGIEWTETRISGPFDLMFAPRAGGALFLGDYTGLDATGSTFLPFFARTNPDTSNRTDIIAALLGPPPTLALKRLADAGEAGTVHRAQPLEAVDLPEGFWDDVAANTARAMEARVPGWSRVRGPTPTPMR
jgi:hypothetical protein